MKFAIKHSQNNLSLSNLIKTTVSDVDYPAWLPGKAPWTVEKGGKGVSTSIDNGVASDSSYPGVASRERDMLTSMLPKDLRPKSRHEAEQMIVVGKELMEIAVKSEHSGINPNARNLLTATLNAVSLKSIKEQHEQKMQPPIARSSDQAIVHPSAGTFSHSLFNPSIPGTSRQAMANSPINHGSRQPQSQSNLLSDEELVSLIKNIKQLPETNQRDLIVMMKDLEKVDPEKSERIRKKLIDSRGK